LEDRRDRRYSMRGLIYLRSGKRCVWDHRAVWPQGWWPELRRKVSPVRPGWARVSDLEL